MMRRMLLGALAAVVLLGGVMGAYPTSDGGEATSEGPEECPSLKSLYESCDMEKTLLGYRDGCPVCIPKECNKTTSCSADMKCDYRAWDDTDQGTCQRQVVHCSKSEYDCPHGQVCDKKYKECVVPCTSSSDCPRGEQLQRCVHNSNINENATEEGICFVLYWSHLPRVGGILPCSNNSQCFRDQECVEGKCFKISCSENSDCTAPNQYCVDHYGRRFVEADDGQDTAKGKCATLSDEKLAKVECTRNSQCPEGGICVEDNYWIVFEALDSNIHLKTGQAGGELIGYCIREDHENFGLVGRLPCNRTTKCPEDMNCVDSEGSPIQATAEGRCLRNSCSGPSECTEGQYCVDRLNGFIIQDGDDRRDTVKGECATASVSDLEYWYEGQPCNGTSECPEDQTCKNTEGFKITGTEEGRCSYCDETCTPEHLDQNCMNGTCTGFSAKCAAFTCEDLLYPRVCPFYTHRLVDTEGTEGCCRSCVECPACADPGCAVNQTLNRRAVNWVRYGCICPSSQHCILRKEGDRCSRDGPVEQCPGELECRYKKSERLYGFDHGWKCSIQTGAEVEEEEEAE